MDSTWEFKAPQFVDFTQLHEDVEEDKKADEFFDVDMEESGELWMTARSESVLGEKEELRSEVKSGTTSNATFTTTSAPRIKLTFGNDVLPKLPMFSKVNKPSNLVTSWDKGQGTLQSSSRPNQPLKKKRRLSNAVVQSLIPPSRKNLELQRRTPRKRLAASITGYKAGATPKRLMTNQVEPRLSQLVGKSKGSKGSKRSQTTSTRTIPKPFKLNTEIRAEERKIIEEKRKKENMLLEEDRRRERERKELEEEAQISSLRKTLIHKAQPVKTFKCLEIRRSKKQLTVPESPKFVPKRLRCIPPN